MDVPFETLIRNNCVANVNFYYHLYPKEFLDKLHRTQFRYDQVKDITVQRNWPMNPTSCYWCSDGVVLNDDELDYDAKFVKRNAQGRTLVYHPDIPRHFICDYEWEWECQCNYDYYPDYPYFTTNRRDAHYQEDRLQLLSATRFCRVKGFTALSALLESILADAATPEQALAKLSLEPQT